MANGRHLENCFFGHNSSTDCPISTMTKQNNMPTNAMWQKNANFENPRWQTAAILKTDKNRHISV